MNNKTWYAIWIAWYIVCAGLGFIPEAAGFGKAVLVALALGFFVPGGMLLTRAIRGQDRNGVLRIRLISLGALFLTLMLILANVLSVGASEAIGNVLYWLLILLSAPMFCGQYWLMTLFLWGCLLTGSFLKVKKS